MSKTYEIKIGGYGMFWNVTPVALVVTVADLPWHCEMQHTTIHTIAQTIADREGREVRYNIEGLGQGHYVQPVYDSK